MSLVVYVSLLCFGCSWVGRLVGFGVYDLEVGFWVVVCFVDKVSVCVCV